MAVHEIHERPDGVVEEYHEFSADEMDTLMRAVALLSKRLSAVAPLFVGAMAVDGRKESD